MRSSAQGLRHGPARPSLLSLPVDHPRPSLSAPAAGPPRHVRRIRAPPDLPRSAVRDVPGGEYNAMYTDGDPRHLPAELLEQLSGDRADGRTRGGDGHVADRGPPHCGGPDVLRRTTAVAVPLPTRQRGNARCAPTTTSAWPWAAPPTPTRAQSLLRRVTGLLQVPWADAASTSGLAALLSVGSALEQA